MGGPLDEAMDMDFIQQQADAGHGLHPAAGRCGALRMGQLPSADGHPFLFLERLRKHRLLVGHVAIDLYTKTD